MNQKAILRLYKPTAAQLQCHLSPHKFNVICFGRQSGKSTYANNKMFQRAWKQENGIYWYVGPTYRLAEQMHDRALFSLKQSGAIKDSSLSDLMVELKSCARIFYKSGDNPGALLGETLHGSVLDECREQKLETWSRVIMPMLGTTGGWCDFLSTPNGFDWFYDLYQNHHTKPNWGAFHAPSTSNPLWTPEMIQEARDSMSEDLFAQEIMAEFRDIGQGTCYVSFGQHNIRDSSPFVARGIDYSPNLPIIVGMDFNISPMWRFLLPRRDLPSASREAYGSH
jgi:Terminase large subunit, T4likevirus-type, N-terminal